MADVELPLSGHLEELRRRLARALLAVAAAFALCYPNAEFLFDLLTAPLLAAGAGTHANELGVELIGTGVAEAFFPRLKVAFIAAVFVALPVVLYQGWMFVLPALKRREVQYVGPFVVFGTVFFLAGAGFCYSTVFPVGFPFFLSEYARIEVAPAIRITEYLSFSSRLLLAFGLTFEMPVVTFFLARMGVVTHRTLLAQFRYAVLVLFIASALLTPPDVVSQLLMVGPLLTLYMLSVAVAWAVGQAASSQRN